MRAPIVQRRPNLLQSMLVACRAGSSPPCHLLPLPKCPRCRPKRWGRTPSSPLPARAGIQAAARLRGQGGASMELCFPLADQLCKPSHFQSPGVWIYSLRPVPSSGRGLGDGRARGSTLYRCMRGSTLQLVHARGAARTGIKPHCPHLHGALGRQPCWLKSISRASWCISCFGATGLGCSQPSQNSSPSLFFPRTEIIAKYSGLPPLPPSSSSVLTSCSSTCASHPCHGCRAYLPAHPRNRTCT